MPARRSVRPTFRTRLLAAIALLAAVGLTAAGVLAYLAERQRTDARMTDSLARAVTELRIYASGESEPGGERRTFASASEVVFGAVRRSVNAADECTLGLAGSPERWVSAGAPAMCTKALADGALTSAIAAASAVEQVRVRPLASPAGSYLYVAVPVAAAQDEGVYGVVMDRGAQQAEVTQGYLRGYVPIAAGTVAAIIGVGWLSAGAVLRPLRLLAATAQQISGSQDLSRRVTVTGRDEVGRLATSFNEMVDSLESSFDSGRQLMDDVGHELRTPLTIIRGHLEVADAESFDHARALALDEVDRMGRLVDSLVTLAQADRPGFVRLEPVELGPLVDDVLDKARMLGPRDWRIEARCEATVQGDAQRLTQALLQLASNAVRYSAADSQVALGVAVRDGEAWLTVRDQGRGVAPEDRKRIFERFARGAGTGRIDGSGLGLPIVAAIAGAHGGRVELNSTLREGSVFAIVLPVAAREQGGAA